MSKDVNRLRHQNRCKADVEIFVTEQARRITDTLFASSPLRRSYNCQLISQSILELFLSFPENGWNVGYVKRQRRAFERGYDNWLAHSLSESQFVIHIRLRLAQIRDNKRRLFDVGKYFRDDS